MCCYYHKLQQRISDVNLLEVTQAVQRKYTQIKKLKGKERRKLFKTFQLSGKCAKPASLAELTSWIYCSCIGFVVTAGVMNEQEKKY